MNLLVRHRNWHFQNPQMNDLHRILFTSTTNAHPHTSRSKKNNEEQRHIGAVFSSLKTWNIDLNEFSSFSTIGFRYIRYGIHNHFAIASASIRLKFNWTRKKTHSSHFDRVVISLIRRFFFWQRFFYGFHLRPTIECEKRLHLNETWKISHTQKNVK